MDMVYLLKVAPAPCSHHSSAYLLSGASLPLNMGYLLTVTPAPCSYPSSTMQAQLQCAQPLKLVHTRTQEKGAVTPQEPGQPCSRRASDPPPRSSVHQPDGRRAGLPRRLPGGGASEGEGGGGGGGREATPGPGEAEVPRARPFGGRLRPARPSPAPQPAQLPRPFLIPPLPSTPPPLPHRHPLSFLSALPLPRRRPPPLQPLGSAGRTSRRLLLCVHV